MASAKKLITAQLDFNAVKEFKGDLTDLILQASSQDQLKALLLERYHRNETGTLSIEIHDQAAIFRWILPHVVMEAEKLHKQALEKARGRQYKEAISNWIKAISLNPRDPDYYFNTGIAFFEEKNYQQSIENLEKTLSLCPIYHKASLILGTIFLKLRKFDKAEHHLKESIYFNPNNSLAILNLAAVYSILKRYDEGINAFEKVLQLVPEEPRAWFGLGKIYSIMGHNKKANECFYKTIELDKKGTLALHAKRALITEETSVSLDIGVQSTDGNRPPVDENTLESILAEGYKAYIFGDYPRAVELYRKYIEYKSKDDYVWYSLGEAYIRTGQVKEAAAAFRNAIKLSPNKGLYYKQLAVAYDYLGESEKAANAAEQATRFGKKDSIVYTIWGKNLLKQKRILDAIDKLETALKLNKANLNAEYHLALAYMENNDQAAALDHLHWILNAKTNSPLKMQAEALLEKINA